MSDRQIKRKVQAYTDAVDEHEVGKAWVANMGSYRIHPRILATEYKVLNRALWAEVIGAISIAEDADLVAAGHKLMPMQWKTDAATRFHATGVGLLVDLSAELYGVALLTRESKADPLKVLFLNSASDGMVVFKESVFIGARGSVLW